MDTIRNNGTGVSVQGCRINNLKFADDIDLLEESQSQLQDNVTRLHEAGKTAGLHINKDKTKTMVMGSADIESQLVVGTSVIENVGEFVYWAAFLHGIMTAARRSPEDSQSRRCHDTV